MATKALDVTRTQKTYVAWPCGTPAPSVLCAGMTSDTHVRRVVKETAAHPLDLQDKMAPSI